MHKFLFLYTELADYFLSCIHALVQELQAEVHIVSWPVNKDAPFQFLLPAGVNVYNKQDYTRQELLQLAHKINPDLIFCSGWLDKDYLTVAKSFRKSVPVLLGLDNHWYGTVKQYTGVLLAPFTLQRIFTHAFVPGLPQAAYARKLSFASKRILEGYYSANVPVFRRQYLEQLATKERAFPRRFIFVGRYVPQKSLDVLWQAFIQLQTEDPNNWDLWCLGTGPLAKEAPSHPQIKHFGFVQPQQMQQYISQTGVFVLPSMFEPWGVVVHEFAAAGFPLICSDAVGSATAFLQENVNGYTFKAGKVSELKRAMKKITALTDTELLQMGEQSIKLAMQNTPSIWAKKLINLLPEQEDLFNSKLQNR